MCDCPEFNFDLSPSSGQSVTPLTFFSATPWEPQYIHNSTPLKPKPAYSPTGVELTGGPSSEIVSAPFSENPVTATPFFDDGYESFSFFNNDINSNVGDSGNPFASEVNKLPQNYPNFSHIKNENVQPQPPFSSSSTSSSSQQQQQKLKASDDILNEVDSLEKRFNSALKLNDDEADYISPIKQFNGTDPVLFTPGDYDIATRNVMISSTPSAVSSGTMTSTPSIMNESDFTYKNLSDTLSASSTSLSISSPSSPQKNNNSNNNSSSFHYQTKFNPSSKAFVPTTITTTNFQSENTKTVYQTPCTPFKTPQTPKNNNHINGNATMTSSSSTTSFNPNSASFSPRSHHMNFLTSSPSAQIPTATPLKTLNSPPHSSLSVTSPSVTSSPGKRPQRYSANPTIVNPPTFCPLNAAPHSSHFGHSVSPSSGIPLVSPSKVSSFQSANSSFQGNLSASPVLVNSAGAEESQESRRTAQRTKQIGYGMNTLGYRNLTKYVPQNKLKGYPMPPNILDKCSKRAWDGQVRKWRRLLHKFDDVTSFEDCEKVKKVIFEEERKKKEENRLKRMKAFESQMAAAAALNGSNGINPLSPENGINNVTNQIHNGNRNFGGTPQYPQIISMTPGQMMSPSGNLMMESPSYYRGNGRRIPQYPQYRHNQSPLRPTFPQPHEGWMDEEDESGGEEDDDDEIDDCGYYCEND